MSTTDINAVLESIACELETLSEDAAEISRQHPFRSAASKCYACRAYALRDAAQRVRRRMMPVERQKGQFCERCFSADCIHILAS
jgi:hypothetical protein